MSGRPIDLLTIPGRAATLAICLTAGRNPPIPEALQEWRNSSNISSRGVERVEGRGDEEDKEGEKVEGWR